MALFIVSSNCLSNSSLAACCMPGAIVNALISRFPVISILISPPAPSMVKVVRSNFVLISSALFPAYRQAGSFPEACPSCLQIFLTYIYFSDVFLVVFVALESGNPLPDIPLFIVDLRLDEL